MLNWTGKLSKNKINEFEGEITELFTPIFKGYFGKSNKSTTNKWISQNKFEIVSETKNSVTINDLKTIFMELYFLVETNLLILLSNRKPLLVMVKQ